MSGDLVRSEVKPPFVYFGGKSSQARRIVSLLPPPAHYVEPFSGSLAVLLAKPPSAQETVNDIDGNLMNFWRVLRDRTDELLRKMALTPHSRAELDACFDLSDDDVERARQVWVRLTQGRAGGLRQERGWRHYQQPRRGGLSTYLAAYERHAVAAAERIREVALECRDALDVIRDYGSHPENLLYCDPPYLGSTRTRNSRRTYMHEFAEEGEHEALIHALRQCRAAVILSGYDSELYRELLGDWHRVAYSTWTGNGIAGDAGRLTASRTEVLWSNRPIGEQALFGIEMG